MKHLLIANWKIYLSHADSIALARQCAQEFERYTNQIDIILCPSLESLQAVGEIINGTEINIGVQSCAPALHGAYTGQVSAANASELGATFCIVGHAEQRALLHMTAQMIEQLIICVLAANMIPVVCIGESAAEQNADTAIVRTLFNAQIQPITHALQKQEYTNTLCIAYEPAWAIGSNTVPTVTQLKERITILYEIFTKELSFCKKIYLLYGGSITADYAAELYTLEGLGGFLVGRATTDFQSFKKIVLSLYT